MTTRNAHPQCGCVQMSYCLSGTLGQHTSAINHRFSRFGNFPLICFLSVVLALCLNFAFTFFSTLLLSLRFFETTVGALKEEHPLIIVQSF